MNKKTCYTKLLYVALMLLLTTVFTENVFAVRYYWVGKAAQKGDGTNVNTLANWQLENGDSIGTNAPSATTTLVFRSSLTTANFATTACIVNFAGGAIDSLIVEPGCLAPIRFNLGTLTIGGSLLFNNLVSVTGNVTINFSSTRATETINPGLAVLAYSLPTSYSTSTQNLLAFSSSQENNTVYTLANNLTCSSIKVSGHASLHLGGKNVVCNDVTISDTAQINIANTTIDCSSNWTYNSSIQLDSLASANSLIRMGFGHFQTSTATAATTRYHNVEFVKGNFNSNPTRGITRANYNKVTISKGSISIISNITTDSLIISTCGAVAFGSSNVSAQDVTTVNKYFEAKPAVNGGQVRLYGTNANQTQINTHSGRHRINMVGSAVAVIERAVIYDLEIKKDNADPTPGYNADKSYNWGNTSGFIFTAPDASKNLYWIGGAGLWSDPAHWSTVSGGTSSPANCIPTLADNVFFDSNANAGEAAIAIGSDGNSLALDMDAWCNNMTWQGVPGDPWFYLTGYDGYCAGNVMIGGSLTLQKTLRIKGSVYFPISTPNQFVFVGNGTNTITTNECPIAANLVFQSVNGAGSWTLTDDLVLNRTALSTAADISGMPNNGTYARNIVFNRGSLNFNGKKVVANGFVGGNDSDNNFENSFSGLSKAHRLLNIANSTIDLALTWQYTGGQQLTLSDNSFILVGCQFSSTSYNIQVKSNDYYHNVEKRGVTGGNLNNPLASTFGAIATGTTFFNKVTLSTTANVNILSTSYLGVIQPDSLLLTGGATYTINRSFTVNKYLATSLECGGKGTIQAPSTTAMTITIGTTSITNPDDRVQVRNVNITYINISSAPAPSGGYKVYDCDVKNSTGWNNVEFPPETFYWVGNIPASGTGSFYGSGNWNDSKNWSKFSGSHRQDATPMGYNNDGTGCIPTKKDNVIFDDYSFRKGGAESTRRVTLNAQADCDSMSWIGTDADPALKPTLYTNSATNTLTIRGSLLLQKGMTLDSGGGTLEIYFETKRVGESITTNGVAMPRDSKLTFTASESNVDYGWKLQDSLKLSSRTTNMVFNSGTLDTQGNTITNFQSFTGTSGSTANRKLIIAGSTISSNKETGTFSFNYTGTLQAANSTLKSYIYGVLNAPAGSIFHNLEIDNLDGGAFNVYRGIFDKITVTKPGLVVVFGRKESGANIVDIVETDTIILANNASHAYEFVSGDTLRVNKAFYGSGTPCNKIYLRSTTETEPAIFDIKLAAANYKDSDTCKIDYAYIHGIEAVVSADNAKLYKGSYSIDIDKTSEAPSGWAYGIKTGNYNLNWARMDAFSQDAITPFGDDVILACKNLPYTLRSDNFLPTPNATFQWYQGNDETHPLGTAATQEVSLPGDYWLEVDYAPGSTTVCKLSDNINITATGSCPTIKAEGDQIVPYGTNTPTKLTSEATGGINDEGGGDDVDYTYQWYVWDGDSWEPIPDATDSEYIPPADLTEDTQYRVVVYDEDKTGDGVNSATSNTITVRVLSVEADEDQTILAGTAPEALTSTVHLTEGDGDDNYEYQWEYWNGDSWEPIPEGGSDDGTNATYQPGNLTETTDYRVKVTVGTATAISDTVKITVTELTTQNEVLCGGEVATITLAPGILAGGTAYWFPSIEAAMAAANYAGFNKTGVYTGDFKTITKNATAVEKTYIRIENSEETGWTEVYPVLLNVFLAPDSLIWTGGGTAGNWHDPANWSWTYPNTKNPDTSCAECQPYWIPTGCTHVLIPEGKNKYPDLTLSTGTVYTPATRYAIAACDHIHFEHGGEVARTDSLHYTEAYVDLTLKSNRWYMLSMPLKNMYAGDIYEHDPNPITDGYKIEPMLFNVANPQTEKQSETDKTYKWTGSFNTPSVEFQSGQGVAVWVDKDKTGYGDHDEVTFSFPKSDTQYNYYYSNGSPTGDFVGPLDKAKKNRFIYETASDQVPEDGLVTLAASPVSEAQQPILVGNPFMSHILFSDFYEQNYTLIENEYRLAQDVSSQNGKVNTFSTFKKDGGSYVSTVVGGGGDLSDQIPPMQSFIVISKGSTQPALKADIAKTLTSPTGTKLRRTPAEVPYMLEITAGRNGQDMSKNLLLYREYASQAYVPEEDSYTLFSQNSLVPVVVYTRSSDGYALDINSFGDFNGILPLGIRTSKKGEVRLTFKGVEKFDDRARIFLHDTTAHKVIDLSTTNEYIFNKNEDDLYVENRLFFTFDAVEAATGINTSTAATSISVRNLPGQNVQIVSNNGSLLRNIQIMDIQGRILETKDPRLPDYTFHVAIKGVYLIRVTTSEGSEVKKVAIK